jgi:hypothetical protein
MDISNLGGAEYETRSMMNAPVGDGEVPAKTSYYFPPGRLHKFSVVKLYNNMTQIPICQVGGQCLCTGCIYHC